MASLARLVTQEFCFLNNVKEYQQIPVVYMLRIFLDKLNKFVYKIGWISVHGVWPDKKDPKPRLFWNRVAEHIKTYRVKDARHIIVVGIAVVAGKCDETVIQNAANAHKFTGLKGAGSRELFHLRPAVRNIFIDTCKRRGFEYHLSANYTIDEDGYEMWLGNAERSRYPPGYLSVELGGKGAPKQY